jgi:hypothetical protein
MHVLPGIGLEGREPGRRPRQFIGTFFHDIDVMTVCAAVSVDYDLDKISCYYTCLRPEQNCDSTLLKKEDSL